MAQIPVIEVPTVKPQGLQPNYQSAATPEGAFGEGYVGAGQQIGRDLAAIGLILAKQREEADITRVNAAAASFNQAAGEITDAAYQTKGQGAIGITQKTTAALTELSKTTAQGLVNDDQRNRFIPHAVSTITGYHSALSRHEGDQTNQLASGTATARVASAYDSAARNWTQPQIVESSLAEVESTTASESDRRGYSEDEKNLALADARSGFYASILRSQTSQGANAAFIKTFEQVQGQLNAKDLSTFSGIYQTTADAAVVFKTSDDIVNQYTIRDQHGRLVSQNLSAINVAANAAPSSIREDVVKQVQLQVAQTQAVQRDYESNVVQSAWESFVRGGGRVELIPMAQRAELQRVAGDVYLRMKEDQIRRASGAPEPFDFAVYGQYESLLPADRLMKGNTAMDMLLGRVPDHVLKEKIDEETITRDQQLGLRTSGAEIRGPSLDTDTVKGMIATSILENDGVFYASGNSTSDTNTMKGQFARRVQEGVASFAKDNKRRPDRDETQKIVDDALITGSRNTRTWFGRDTGLRSFQVPPGDFTSDTVTVPPPTEAPVSSISSSERASIAARLKASNIPVTEATIEQQYVYDHRLDGGSK